MSSPTESQPNGDPGSQTPSQVESRIAACVAQTGCVAWLFRMRHAEASRASSATMRRAAWPQAGRPTRAPRQTTAAALSTSRCEIRSPGSVPSLPRALVSFVRGGGLACRVHRVDGVWGCVAVTHRASLGGASPSCLASRGSARPRACFATPAGRRSRCTIASSAAVLKPSARTLGPVPTQNLRGFDAGSWAVRGGITASPTGPKPSG